jgi:hypothetical protein
VDFNPNRSFVDKLGRGKTLPNLFKKKNEFDIDKIKLF